MNWIKSIVTWLLSLFVHEAVEQVKEEIKKPSTIQDAQTPPTVVSDLRRELADELRDKNGGR